MIFHKCWSERYCKSSVDILRVPSSNGSYHWNRTSLVGYSSIIAVFRVDSWLWHMGEWSERAMIDGSRDVFLFLARVHARIEAVSVSSRCRWSSARVNSFFHPGGYFLAGRSMHFIPVGLLASAIVLLLGLILNVRWARRCLLRTLVVVTSSVSAAPALPAGLPWLVSRSEWVSARVGRMSGRKSSRQYTCWWSWAGYSFQFTWRLRFGQAVTCFSDWDLSLWIRFSPCHNTWRCVSEENESVFI